MEQDLTYIAALSKSDREFLREFLALHFPELGTDEPMNGGDIVQELCRIYEELSK